MQSANDQFKTLKDEFLRIAKNIFIYKTENRALPASEKISKDIENLLNSYDRLAAFIKLIINDQNKNQIDFLSKSFEHFFKPKLIETLSVYNFTINLPDNFENLDRNTLIACTREPLQNISDSTKKTGTHSLRQIDLFQQEAGTSSQKEQLETINESIQEEFASAESDSEDTVVNQSQNNNLDNSIENPENSNEIVTENYRIETAEPVIQNANMVQTNNEFLSLAAKILNYKYDGDPAKLNSFITDIELVEGLVEANNATVKAFCLKFVKSKLEGKASECVSNDVASTEAIKTALIAQIKAESSKIIEGKMTALRIQRGDFTKFQEEADKLAEQLRRSLISEGFSRDKANELAIDKTIEMCRKTARNDVVKSVISSTHYTTAGEVIAKFITQNDLVRKEIREKKAYDTIKSQNRSNKGNGQQNFNRDRKNGYQNYNNNGKQNKNFNGNRNERSYGQGSKRSNDNSRGKYNKNEHTIRIVSHQQPSTSHEPDVQSNTNGEAFFRLSSP